MSAPTTGARRLKARSALLAAAVFAALLPTVVLPEAAAAQGVTEVQCEVTFDASRTEATVASNPAGDDPIDVVIERSKNEGNWFWAARVSAGTDFVDDQSGAGLDPEATYAYRVRSAQPGLAPTGGPVTCTQVVIDPPDSAPLPVTVCAFLRGPYKTSALVLARRAANDGATSVQLEVSPDGGAFVPVSTTPFAPHVSAVVGLDHTVHNTFQTRAVSETGVVSDATECTEYVPPPAPSVDSPEWYQTSLIDGRYEIVETSSPNTPAQWRAVAIKGEQFFKAQGGEWVASGYDPSAPTLTALSERFNVVRLALRWDQIEPDGPSTAESRDAGAMANVTKTINLLGDLGVGVILDPFHGTDEAAIEDGQSRFTIPKWVWDTTGLPTGIDNMFEVAAWPDATGTTYAGAYLERMVEWSKQFPNVVALELMNEPHPPDGEPYANTDLVVELEAEWVDRLRRTDPDIPLILSGFYGNQLSSASVVAAGLVGSDGRADHNHLVWSAHSYATGVYDINKMQTQFPFSDDDGDGFIDSTYPTTWARGQAVIGLQASGWKSGGCYGENAYRVAPGGAAAGGWACTGITALQRANAQAIRQNAINSQDLVAQAGHMPLILGEFAAPRYWNNTRLGTYVGWGDSYRLACDWMQALHNVGPDGANAVSYAYWHFDQPGGERGFELYETATGRWFDDPTGNGSVTYAGDDQGTARVFGSDRAACESGS